MNLALFRTDGSHHLGLGHVMRCLAFARGLEERGLKPLFVTRDYEAGITEIIRRHGGIVEPVPGNCDFDKDLRLTLKVVKKHKIRLVITDLCNADILEHPVEYAEYLRGLKIEADFLVTIDDLNTIRFPSDILINPNCGAERMPYSPGDGTKYLLGPAYFIFRKEFIDAAGTDMAINKVAQNILITLGGSDLLNLNVKVARALAGLSQASELSLRIALGLEEAKHAELKEILGGFAGDFQLMQNAWNMASLMRWADLAVIAGGLTKYEAAISGTPAIIISQVFHQANLALDFEKAGTALNLGLGSAVSEQQIAEAVTRLLKGHSLRAQMSKSGRELVDGRGIERIIAEMPGEVFL